MEKLFNFKLNPEKKLSSTCISLGLNDFETVCQYVKEIPYGRLGKNSNYTAILAKNKGTCSTKHAFLKQLAIENEAEKIKLFIGIYKMCEANTKGVGKILNKYNLEYIPEAHTYLKFTNAIYDFTNNTKNKSSFSDSILLEREITPSQTTGFKVLLHKKYIKKWILTNNIPVSFTDLWSIREACIVALSK
ncbi:MAG: hypothetical protein ACPG6B_10210 [Oceanihabitans sp.]